MQLDLVVKTIKRWQLWNEWRGRGAAAIQWMNQDQDDLGMEFTGVFCCTHLHHELLVHH